MSASRADPSVQATSLPLGGWILATTEQVPTSDAWFSVQEQSVLAGLSLAKRRTDWRLGRWASKCLVQKLLRGSTPVHLQDAAWNELLAFRENRPAVPAEVATQRLFLRLSILAASDGSPELWFDRSRLPVSLSLSHSAGLAAALVVPGHKPVGIDLERIEPRSAAFLEDHLTEAERAWMTRQPAPARAATLLWSAKEAVLKTRRTGLRESPQAVQIRFMPIPPRALSACPMIPFEIRPAEPVTPGLPWWGYHAPSKKLYLGEWYLYRDWVITLVRGEVMWGAEPAVQAQPAKWPSPLAPEDSAPDTSCP